MALYVREFFDHLELCNSEDEVECLCVKRKANKANIMVGVCYKLTNQNGETDYLLYKELGVIS